MVILTTCHCSLPFSSLLTQSLSLMALTHPFARWRHMALCTGNKMAAGRKRILTSFTWQILQILSLLMSTFFGNLAKLSDIIATLSPTHSSAHSPFRHFCSVIRHNIGHSLPAVDWSPSVLQFFLYHRGRNRVLSFRKTFYLTHKREPRMLHPRSQ